MYQRKAEAVGRLRIVLPPFRLLSRPNGKLDRSFSLSGTTPQPSQLTAARVPFVILDVSDGVAFITLNRPDRLNAYTTEGDYASPR